MSVKVINTPKLRFKGFSDEWEQCKLGEVARLSSSKRIHLSDYVESGIPFYRGSEISTGGITGKEELYISEEKYNEITNKYEIPVKGDLLITAVGTLGNVWKVDNRRFYYKDGNLIRISDMNFNSDYFVSYLSGGIGKKRLIDSAAGSNQKALTMVKMKKILIPLPSKDEQTKIGNLFSSLDHLIALHQHKLENLEQTKKGLLQNMFPKNNEVSPYIRFNNFIDEWEQCKLKDIVKWSRGKGLAKSVLNYDQKGNDVIHYADLYKFNPVIYDVIHWSETNEGTIIPKNSILFPMSDVTPVGLARTSTIIKNDVRAGSDTLIGTIDNKDNSQFISYQINKNYQNILPLVTGTTVRHISSKSLGTLRILLPSIKEQSNISAFFNSLDHLIALHQSKLEKLEKTKQSLLQQMFV